MRGMWLLLLILTFHFAYLKELRSVWVHIPSTLLRVCAFALWTHGIKRFSVYSYRLCVLGPKLGFIYKRSSQLEVRSCAKGLRQSCKQKTAGFRTYKCAVGILWASHWPGTCHSWLSALVVVGAQNYKSKQEQMDVVSLNIIPEKPAFNINVFLKQNISPFYCYTSDWHRFALWYIGWYFSSIYSF